MFDTASRQALQDSLDYENFVINEAMDAVERHRGVLSPVALVVEDEPPHSLGIEIRDEVGSSSANRMVSQMSPLLLVAAFKLNDMVLEWVLDENRRRSRRHFWQFAEKAQELQRAGLVFPDFLATDNALRQVFEALYIHVWPRRNALVHGTWGTLVNGDVHFSFQFQDVMKSSKPTVVVHEVCPLSDILCYAEASSKLAGMLVAPCTQRRLVLDGLRFLYDRLTHMHGCAPFGVTVPRYYRVVRRTRLPQVDVDDIRRHIQQLAPGEPYVFSLRLENLNTSHVLDLTEDEVEKVQIVNLAGR